MGVYNSYERMPKSCRGCKYCKNKTNGGFSGYEATYDDEYCDLLKVKLFDHLTEKGKINFYGGERYKDCPLIEVKAPHGDLKDFNKVVSYRINADISCGDCRAPNQVGWVILDKDWQNVPIVIAAEE